MQNKRACWTFDMMPSGYFLFMRQLSQEEMNDKNEQVRQHIIELTGINLPPFKECYVVPQDYESTSFTHEIKGDDRVHTLYPDLKKEDQKTRLYKL
jgi:hypothetical protein